MRLPPPDHDSGDDAGLTVSAAATDGDVLSRLPRFAVVVLIDRLYEARDVVIPSFTGSAGDDPTAA